METGDQRGVHVPPGEGESVWVAGSTYTFKATAENTGGALLLVDASVPPQAGPPPHIDHRVDETFFVLEGEIEFLEGDRTFVAGVGSFVFIPKGVVHAFKNVGTGTARILATATPAGLEEYFREAGRPAGEGAAPPPGPEEIQRLIALAPKYGTEILPPEE